ncbi:hypothetical protein F511_00057 [Dorcoceras hygrometricum]|nr:hypothetical protein F511_00057 [Dorcoceras hygrometricum]
MASNSFIFLFLLFISFNFFQITVQKRMISVSFPLTSAPMSRNDVSKAKFSSSLMSTSSPSNVTGAQKKDVASPSPFSYDYTSSFKYSMALIVSLPVGTPPQAQQVVIDTGSQLSWIHCHKKSPETPTFDPSLSSTFSLLPCTHPLCKPRIPDFTLPTSCDQNRLCHYSYFYADGTLAEGNLVRERFTFSRSRTTPPLILGCTTDSAEAEGILGMNLGRLSFASQAKVPRFSYCVPSRNGNTKVNPTGTFYLGRNPNSPKFRYINLLSFPRSHEMPNFDPLAYTIPMTGIRVGGTRLNISSAVFRPDAGGSGQTMIDSGTQYTFLVEAAYSIVREHVVRLAGPKLKKGYVYGGSLDMCFDGNPTEIGRLIGDMSFEFDNGLEILTNKERILDDVGDGVHCLGIGRSDSLGVASNIIGNFHQQNHWVEFDLIGRRVGFGVANCGPSL